MLRWLPTLRSTICCICTALTTLRCACLLTLSTFFFLTCLRPAQASTLLAQGPWIVNSTTNQRVYLKCANWYGAHTELFVVGGLETKSVAQLADSFKRTGANCARIPYSVEMAKYNPVVAPSSVSAVLPSDGCASTVRALDVMDCVVSHLQRRGILIFFNNHNSYGTWVGSGGQMYDQGLWNLPGYPTEDWIQSLEIMARRYKMAGMDLRNEIHDQDGVRVTWGESDDVDTDWLAASSLAYDRLHAIDPEILAIVGGLCWNFDLRKMARQVGPYRAFNNRKLVYTVHLYSFSFWWRAGELGISKIYTLSLFLGVLSLVSSLACYYSLYYEAVKEDRLRVKLYTQYDSVPQRTTPTRAGLILALLGSSALFFAGWLTLAVVFVDTATRSGCSTLAEDAKPLVVAAAILLSLTGLAFFACAYLAAYMSWLLTLGSLLMWAGFWFVTLAIVCAYLESEQGHRDYLKLWALNDRPVPVWVSEFGTGVPDESIFQFLWRFISQDYELDFAYWAFNGKKYKDSVWVSEPFGLLDDDWNEWRFPAWVRALFA